MATPPTTARLGARLRRIRISGPLALVACAGEATLPLPLGVLTIGRSHVNDLVVRAPRVFARHATLLVERSAATVEAAQPTAELRVNDTPVGRATLTPGDMLSIGSATFRLESRADAAGPTEKVAERVTMDWIGTLEQLHEWSRSGPLDRRGAMLGLLVERLDLGGAALVTLGPTGGVQVLNAWGEVAELLRTQWVRERLEAATRSWSPAFETRANDALAIVTGPGAAPVGLLARRLAGDWDPAILRLAARFFAHEHVRIQGAEPVDREIFPLAFPAGMVIGRAPSMQRMYAEVHAVADGDLPVVLLGETGVGKGVVARLLHDSSDRRHLPFVAIDCGLPWEAFVHELTLLHRHVGRGAQRGEGARRAAAPGTILLDEVGRLEAQAQSALMAALNEFASLESAASAPRLIATTNVDSHAALASAAIRRDLWYRLAGAVITVPALRDRIEDLPLLFDHFLLSAVGPRRPPVSPEALRVLLAHDWPGNLRQLRWEAQRAASRAARAGEIGLEQLSPALRTQAEPTESSDDLRLADHFERVERRLLLGALHAAGGNLSQVARLLGITRARVRRRMAALDVRWPPEASSRPSSPPALSNGLPLLPRRAAERAERPNRLR